jgi:hypothetical protein
MTVLHAFMAGPHESIYIELVVRKDHIVQEVLRACPGVMQQAGEGSNRLWPRGTRRAAVVPWAAAAFSR